MPLVSLVRQWATGAGAGGRSGAVTVSLVSPAIERVTDASNPGRAHCVLVQDCLRRGQLKPRTFVNSGSFLNLGMRKLSAADSASHQSTRGQVIECVLTA